MFNGEIYNYLQLKQELISKGYLFKSKGDAEVILNGYLEWGDKISEKLEGMFAFAILDSNKRSIFISRDQMGIKPFIYNAKQRYDYIGSENKTIKGNNKFRS